MCMRALLSLLVLFKCFKHIELSLHMTHLKCTTAEQHIPNIRILDKRKTVATMLNMKMLFTWIHKKGKRWSTKGTKMEWKLNVYWCRRRCRRGSIKGIENCIHVCNNQRTRKWNSMSNMYLETLQIQIVTGGERFFEFSVERPFGAIIRKGHWNYWKFQKKKKE